MPSRTVEQYEAELASLNIAFRWGEARRFQSNARKIARRNWLIAKIAELRSTNHADATKS